MKDQDIRAVEAMCSCGMDFDTLCVCFPSFPKAELKNIYDNFVGLETKNSPVSLNINCS
ncbi:MAG: hypothetical protein K6E79_00390 [Pseudobutyrivibrio sp.]|nr:hypothetical protein [Pseudobutyrivibrio sp.]